MSYDFRQFLYCVIGLRLDCGWAFRITDLMVELFRICWCAEMGVVILVMCGLLCCLVLGLLILPCPNLVICLNQESCLNRESIQSIYSH